MPGNYVLGEWLSQNVWRLDCSECGTELRIISSVEMLGYLYRTGPSAACFCAQCHLTICKRCFYFEAEPHGQDVYSHRLYCTQCWDAVEAEIIETSYYLSSSAKVKLWDSVKGENRD